MKFCSRTARELMELRQQMPGALDRARHELREEADERGEAEEVALAMHVAQVEIDGVAQRLEGEERDADREQVLKAERHERGGIGQLQRDMEPGEDAVQVLRNEAGVLEEEQQGEVVDQADDQPDPAAAVKRAQAHQQHEQAKARHGGRSVFGPDSRQDDDAEAASTEPRKANFRTRSSNCRRVNRASTSTF